MKSYLDFLKNKVIKAPVSGIDVSVNEISSVLKPHQRDAVIWALKGGRRALFEAFGLGKSIQQLEWCRVLTERIGGKALIVCPLGVKQEFTEDAVNLLHIPAPTYVRNMADVNATENKIVITNYERVRDGDIDPHQFTACSLDEASVLRSFGSKTYQTFLPKFAGVKYKLVATATPAPNRYKELIHYGGYLEVMDTGQALTRFFQRDSTKANNLTLYPHKEKEFWLWLSTWALFIQRPSDLGYSDDGYALPPIVDDLKDMPMSDIRKLYNKYSRETVYDFEKHVELANAMDDKDKLPATFMCIDPASWSPDVWDDVNRMRTLNTEQSRRRKQMHLCPLQFDIVDRLINRYTNKGETVLDPFGGLMTVPLEAIKAGRKGIGIELNPEYYHDGCWYLKKEELNQETPDLFELAGI